MATTRRRLERAKQDGELVDRGISRGQGRDWVRALEFIPSGEYVRVEKDDDEGDDDDEEVKEKEEAEQGRCGSESCGCAGFGARGRG